MPGARRLIRSGHVGKSDVRLYTNASFGGSALRITAGSDMSTLPAGYDNAVRSIASDKPVKAYLYENAHFDGAILFLEGVIKAADLSRYYFENTKQFSNHISSLQVRDQSYVIPAAPATPSVKMTDGHIIPALPGNCAYGNCVIEHLTFDIADQTAYDNFMAAFGPMSTAAERTATEQKVLYAINQIARNVNAVLYRDPDQQPARYPTTALHFVYTDDSSLLAWSTPETSDIFITNNAAAQTPRMISFVLAHELAHSYQNAKFDSENAKLLGTLEGIATYVTLKHGYSPSRPATTGANWYDGYDVTGLFFDYIVSSSPKPEPDFVHKLVLSMNGADPAIGGAAWSDSVITSLNSRGKTVDELWQEYVSWVAKQ